MTLTAFRQVSADPGVSWLDALAAPDAREVLWDCCPSARWVERIEALRPFRTRGRLVDLSDAVTRRLEWIEVRQALTSFPRLGDPRPESGGQDTWVRQEPAAFAVGGIDDEPLARAVALGAREYEERFGFVFLICSQGRTTQQTLAALSTRLTNDPRAERLVVRAELAAIARIRLVKLLAQPQPPVRQRPPLNVSGPRTAPAGATWRAAPAGALKPAL